MATPNVGLYVPDADTPISPLVPIFAGMQGSVDTYLNRKGRAFPNNAARDVAIPSPVYGDFCTSGTGSGFEFQAYDGTTWQTVWSGASMGWVELLADTGWVSSGLDIVPYVYVASLHIEQLKLSLQLSRLHQTCFYLHCQSKVGLIARPLGLNHRFGSLTLGVEEPTYHDPQPA